MSDRRKDLRPREKLQARGAEALSDYELLMAIIGSGTQYADVTKLAREVQKLLKEKGSELAYEDLLSVKSLGPAKATNIMAGFELWRRQFEVSERLQRAGELLGIELIDHVVITSKDYKSIV